MPNRDCTDPAPPVYHPTMPPNSSDHASPEIRLRDIVADDLPILFEHELDPDANLLAAVFPRDRKAFDLHWKTLLADPSIVSRAILMDDRLVGRISCFQMDGQDSIGYWIAKEHWAKGIATRAIRLLLDEVPTRPLHAQAARHNTASIRALERNGFVITAHRHAPPSDRFRECEEVTLLLS